MLSELSQANNAKESMMKKIAKPLLFFKGWIGGVGYAMRYMKIAGHGRLAVKRTSDNPQGLSRLS